MTTIQSNLDKAQQIATAMGQAADNLSSSNITGLQLSEKTNILANQRAKEISREVKDLINKFIQRFENDINNLNSAAKEFQRIDEEIKNTIYKK